ncbi:MAG TPA: hypothetical protein VM012_09445, partial [Flavitalea sp.]|nr:hypothetical protein [Flavitalea sp.]
TYPQSLTTSTIATFVFDLPFTGVVSAALSPDGKEILLKTYTNIYYFKRNEGASLLDALKSQPVTVDYVTEPLGEAIAFGRDGKGIYTLSEKGTAATVNLFYYQRK